MRKICQEHTVKNKGCTNPGCERKHYARGLCKKHYRKFLRLGDPLISIYEMGHGPYCMELGCNGEHHSKGYCLIHFKRWRRTGSTNLNRNFKYKGKRLH